MDLRKGMALTKGRDVALHKGMDFSKGMALSKGREGSFARELPLQMEGMWFFRRG
jgi:hypothetical protein